jgi:hypothetical protein
VYSISMFACIGSCIYSIACCAKCNAVRHWWSTSVQLSSARITSHGLARTHCEHRNEVYVYEAMRGLRGPCTSMRPGYDTTKRIACARTDTANLT